MATKVDRELEEAAEQHADDPERSDLITRARRFKASWVELAEALVAVKKNQRWRGWGHDSFEAYAMKELRLRQETVDKLTGSYAFLKKRAPEVFHRDGVEAPIPSYQAIDFLRRAEEKDDAAPDVVDEIRRRVLDDCASPAQVKRQYGDVVFPLPASERKARDLAAIRNVATRLRDLLGETRAVPRHVGTEVREALDKLLSAVGERGDGEVSLAG